MRKVLAKLVLTGVAVLLTEVLAGGMAAAQAPTGTVGPAGFPNKPIRMIVPYGAGGAADVYARLLTDALKGKMPTTFVIENRPGGNASVGTALVAKAAPDGYTLLFSTNTTMAAAPAQFKTPPYTVDSFAGLLIWQESSVVMLVRPEEKGVTLTQFVEKMRVSPEKFAVGTVNLSGQSIQGLFIAAANLKHAQVPYTTSGPATVDFLSGRLAGLMLPINPALDLVNSGKAIVMAVGSQQPLPMFPGVPTFASIYPDVWVSILTGYHVPAGTPKSVIDYLSRQFLDAYRNDAALAKHTRDGGRPLFMGPEETDEFMRKDQERWIRYYKAAGIEPQ